MGGLPGIRAVRCCSWVPQRGAKCWCPQLERSCNSGRSLRGHHLLRPQAPPLPPSSSSPPARPIRSPRPRRAGCLSGRRRLSATLASRGARRPGTSPTPGTPPAPARSLSPVVASPGTSQLSHDFLLFLPKGKGRRKRSGCTGERASRGPCPGGSGLEGGGGRRRREVRVTPRRRVFHLQAEAAAASCVKAAAAAAAAVAAGLGLEGLLAMEGRSRPGGRQDLLGLLGLLCRHPN